MSQEMVLDVKDLSSGYAGVQVLQGLNFSVRRGEILAIVGRNGVGKTTLMRALMGELRAYKGSISLLGDEVTGLSTHMRARRGLGYVPQGRGIFARMTVAANLQLGQTIGPAGGRPGYERVFGFFPILKKRLPQRAGSMSGGEQQQLAIGRVLVGHPELVLLDEPSEGIQPNIIQMIGDIVNRLRDEQGMSVMIVEQNLDLIHAVADRCLVIDKGRIVAELEPDELLRPEVAKQYLAI